MGVPIGTLSYWLSGWSLPDLALLVALAGRLGVTSAHLTGEIEITPDILKTIVQKVAENEEGIDP